MPAGSMGLQGIHTIILSLIFPDRFCVSNGAYNHFRIMY